MSVTFSILPISVFLLINIHPRHLAALERPIRKWLEEVRHDLTRLLQDAHQIPLNLAIVHPVDKGEGSAIVAHPTGSSNPVHILLDLTRHVEVDNILNIRDVKSTCQYCSGRQYRSLASAEVRQGLLSLSLTPVAMNCPSGIAFPAKLLTKLLSFVFCPQENQSLLTSMFWEIC